MEPLDIAALSTPALLVLIFFVGAIALAAVKLLWGMAQWTQRPQHRVGDRWGAEPAEVVEWRDGSGYVRAGGELWRARSKENFAPGDPVRVHRMNGLVLDVRRDRTAA